MYTCTNFKTKKALKEAVARGQDVRVFQPGPSSGGEPSNGEVSVEGPHSDVFPSSGPHWSARVMLHEGRVVHVK